MSEDKFYELEYEGQEFYCYKTSQEWWPGGIITTRFKKGRTYDVRKGHDGVLYLGMDDGYCLFGAPKDTLKHTNQLEEMNDEG